ncbi:hypothetical protein [Pseudomonas aeruginosa]|uniref:hypothetical protein n=2 Tax=Pseudomonas aeruginosa TaxID=287 RepID=UPI000F53188C|nr:hypothetical protein [Pseudomonas aeruginosa]WCW10108.1 hypothetical protein KK222_11455 [Pseudomonas aeruginosa]
MDEGQDLSIFRPNIAYVDELEDERDNFFTDAYDSECFDKIYLLEPEREIDEMVRKLLDLDIDALVSDFNLSEASALSYDGEQLVLAFLAVKSEFPCFIRTSYDDQAVIASDDVNRVYSKNVAHDEGAGRYLFKRVVQQVRRYKQRIGEWQDELSNLLIRNPNQLVAVDVERILELDAKLESCLGKDVAIPTHVKRRLLASENNLVQETERLIADIRCVIDGRK